jgi:hypothetical protein
MSVRNLAKPIHRRAISSLAKCLPAVPDLTCDAEGRSQVLDLNGAAGWDRTSDPWLRRPILYPLSYSRAGVMQKRPEGYRLSGIPSTQNRDGHCMNFLIPEARGRLMPVTFDAIQGGKVLYRVDAAKAAIDFAIRQPEFRFGGICQFHKSRCYRRFRLSMIPAQMRPSPPFRPDLHGLHAESRRSQRFLRLRRKIAPSHYK